MLENLIITSPCFVDGGHIPKKYTGFGEDVSPAFNISGISENAVSVAIVMDDLDVPFSEAFTHWVVWNIPRSAVVTENLEAEPKTVVQGNAWGKNRYRGPKQPVFVRQAHRYRFSFYALDLFLELDGSCGKNELVEAMNGHILQTGEIVGVYKR